MMMKSIHLDNFCYWFGFLTKTCGEEHRIASLWSCDLCDDDERAKQIEERVDGLEKSCVDYERHVEKTVS
jgi:hypothetical protein